MLGVFMAQLLCPGFEAAPFKLPSEYVEVLGGIEGPAFLEFKRLFREGFEAARKHCDRILSESPFPSPECLPPPEHTHVPALVELMQKGNVI